MPKNFQPLGTAKRKAVTATPTGKTFTPVGGSKTPSAGNVAGNLASDLGAAAVGFFPGLVSTVRHPVRTGQQVAHAEAYTWGPYFSAVGKLAHGDVAGANRDLTTFQHRAAEHPLGPILDVATVFGGVGARTAAVGALEKGASRGAVTRAVVRGQTSGPLRTVTARLSENSAPVTLRTLPRNARRAARIEATDKLLKRLPPETPGVGEYARAARAVQRETAPTLLRHRGDPRLLVYQRAFSKLSTPERVALATIARVPLQADLEGWKRILREGGEPAQRLHDLLSDPKVLSLYEQPSPKLVRAHEAARLLVEAREEITARTGQLDPEAAAAAVYAPSRVARGAEFVEPTKAKLGVPSPILVYQRNRVERLQKLFDRAYEKARSNAMEKLDSERQSLLGLTIVGSKVERIGKSIAREVPSDVPRTPEQARERLSYLEKQHEKFAQAVHERLFGKWTKEDAAEQARRNKHNGKFNRQQKGVTRTGSASGAAGYKKIQHRLPTVKEEQRAVVEEEIAKMLDRAAHDPTAQAIIAQREEIARLKDALAPLPGDPITIERLGTEKGTRRVSEPIFGERGIAIPAHGAVRARSLGAQLSGAKEELARAEAAAARRVRPTGLVGGGKAEDIAAEIEDAGRPQPFYMPDAPAGSKKTRSTLTNTAGTTSPLSDIRQSRRILMRTGQLALHPDVLTPAFMRAAQYEYRLEKHQLIKQVAVPIEKGAGLPAGFRWVREVRGEHIPFTETSKGEHLAELDKFVKGEQHPFTVTEKEAEKFTDDEFATNETGHRLAVPEKFAALVEGEYHRGNKALVWLIQKPVDVWRALVLNLRIPWLVNNIVGNSFLAALRFAGVDGLKAFVSLIGDTRGPQAVRALLKQPATRRSLTAEDMQAIFPEQLRGTFIETQTPHSLGAGRVRRIARAAGGGLAPLDRVTEQGIRRFATETVLRGSDEVKAIYKAMPKQTRTWREAMVKAASGNPDLRRLVVNEVNAALGDYLSLSPTERGWLRRVVPFYAWYREITRIAARTVVDTPGRTDLLSRLGVLEEERQADQRGPYPSFLHGSYYVGPGPQGTQRVVALRSANPFSTVEDVGKVGAFLVHPNSRTNAQAVIGLGNPFLAAAVTDLVRSSQGDPNDPKYLGKTAEVLAKGWFPGHVLAQVAGGLPQVQLLTPPPPSKLYPTRDRWTVLLRLLGDLRKDVNPSQAAYYASQGR